MPLSERLQAIIAESDQELAKLNERRTTLMGEVNQIDDELKKLRAIRRAAGLEDNGTKQQRTARGYKRGGRTVVPVSAEKLDQIRAWVRSYDGDSFTIGSGAKNSAMTPDVFRRGIYMLVESREVVEAGTGDRGVSLYRKAPADEPRG